MKHYGYLKRRGFLAVRMAQWIKAAPVKMMP